jgi:hypothetical protein
MLAHLHCIREEMRQAKMDSDYVFLCGVMWCGYGQQEAGKELFRATSSLDPDIRALAWALLARGMSELRRRVTGDPGREQFGHTQSAETMPVM